MATLTFLGAAQEVTGSCYLLQTDRGRNILLDCGMHQGGDALQRIEDEAFAFDPARIDAVVISHAHLDHSGLLPKLYQEGYTGPVYCTRATGELLEIMLRDSVGLYLRDLDRHNLRLARRGKPPVPPAITLDAVEGVLGLRRGCAYRKDVHIDESVVLRFFDAGHILGSAIIELQLSESGESSEPLVLVFSGDLGKSDSVLMNEPHAPSRANVLLVESTYGDREHRAEQDSKAQLRDILRDTWRAGGSVMIPAFAVGRTQDLLFHLGCLAQEGELDPWEVFLDSPMAIDVTQIYDRWLSALDGDDVRHLSEAHRTSLENFLPRLSLARQTEESMAINRIKSGAIIIAGSGMCTGGRIRHHFKQRIWDDRNTIIFTGYQARGTLGRILVDGAQHIKLFGEEYVVKARIETLGGLSAHAGQTGLVNWVKGFSGPPRTYLVHGEKRAQSALAQRLREDLGLQAQIPSRGESIEI